MSEEATETVTGMAVEGMGLLSRLGSLSSIPAHDELRNLPLDLLFDLRRAVALLQPAGWQALCAIDARLVEIAGIKRGRAGRDGSRLYARYHRLRTYAQQLGIRGPSVLLHNAAIHDLLVQAEIITVVERIGSGPVTVSSILSDREDYDQALIFAAPLVALRQIAAYRLRGEKLNITRLTHLTPTLTSEVCGSTNDKRSEPEAVVCIECRIIEHVRRTVKLFQEQILPDCPTQRWRDRLYLDWMDDLNDTLNDLGKHTHGAKEQER